MDDISDEDIELFKEDLSKTTRECEEINDGENTFYKFTFTFNDVNNYLANTGTNFDTLVDNEHITDDSEIEFTLEIDDVEENLGTWILSITDETYIFTSEDDEGDEDIIFEDELDFVMYDNDDWKDEYVLQFWVPSDTDGKIKIKINNVTVVKNFSELTYEDGESDDELYCYSVKVGDLDIEEPGDYTLLVYILDDEDNIICSNDNDEDEPELLILREPQIAGNENVTIETAYGDISYRDDAEIITITTEKTEGNVVIYVDDNEEPIVIPFSKLTTWDEGYVITSKDLGLPTGEYELNITCLGANLIAKVNLISSLEIELPDESIIVTTGDGFQDIFAWIDFIDEEKDIYESVDGIVNVTIYDEAGNVADSIQKNITSLYYDPVDSEAYVVRVNDLNNQLNGTYHVSVSYKGSEGSTEKSGQVQFKLFDPADYKTSVKDTIENEDDYLITFAELPPADEVIVKIDGTEKYIDEMDLSHNEDDGIYYIKLNDLGPLDDGSHSIVVGIEVDGAFKELGKANVIVDLKENIDPALTITVANIEEGNAATVVITTNSTFTGEVTVQVANTEYKVNVTKGQGSTQITGLKANTYTATALFKSDGIFTDATKAATFTVTAKPAAPSTPAAPAKKVIKLTLKKVKVKKSAKKLVLKATLKINGKAPKKGTKIKFTFKGKKYIGKTNKKGVAKVIIKKKVLKKLKVGKKVKYTAKYSTKTVKRTAKVKR